MIIQFKMMQDQTTENLIVNSTRKTSVDNEGHDKQGHLVIDFENIEDILDFSACPLSKANLNLKQRLARQHKITAKDPVKLLELKPVIDKYVNDVQKDSENTEGDHETKDKKKRKFQCTVCGFQFIRLTHLQRHMRIHTGAKPYACDICRKPFSRRDYATAHARGHHKEKIHCCCVCGEVYTNLEEFSEHCHTHDDDEYKIIDISRAARKKKAHFSKHVLVGKDPILVTTAAEEIVLNACVTIEKVDNSTVEEFIVHVQNPMYQQEAIAINSDDVCAAASTSGISSSGNLMLSTND